MEAIGKQNDQVRRRRDSRAASGQGAAATHRDGLDRHVHEDRVSGRQRLAVVDVEERREAGPLAAPPPEQSHTVAFSRGRRCCLCGSRVSRFRGRLLWGSTFVILDAH
jgi:hypothetical protein